MAGACTCYKSSHIFFTGIFYTAPAQSSRTFALLRARSRCFSNTVANTDIHLAIGSLSIVTPSLNVPRLLYSALTFRILRPPRSYPCATMAQAAVLTNGAKASASDSVRVSPAASTPTAGTKRKRANEQKFYAVRQGKRPGIYNTWEECLSQVTGHKGASCRSSRDLEISGSRNQLTDHSQGFHYPTRSSIVCSR